MDPLAGAEMGGTMRLLCVLALVVMAGCDPASSPVSPSGVHSVNTVAGGAVDVCAAIRSGRIKPLAPVSGC